MKRLFRILCLATFSMALAQGPSLAQTDAQTGLVARPDLSGRVLDKDGTPLSEVTVFIFTAGPRMGRGVLCPSCYADCQKRATTDAEGRFKIEALDPQLLFRILAVARDHVPTFVPKVDPLKGLLEVSLERRKQGEVAPKRSLTGRVVDPEGKPLFGAVVSFEFYWFGKQDGCGGNCEGVDLVAVTDREGKFLLTTKREFHSMSVTIEARALAKKKYFKLTPGKLHELKLAEGASVSGRVLKDGAPVPNITVGIVSVDRSENFTGSFEINTDAAGRFLIPNIPTYQSYFVYGLLESLKNSGSLPVKQFRVSGDGTTKDVGELSVVPGHRLAGQIVLSDHKPIPPGTRLLLSRQDAWDHTVIDLDVSGKFTASQLPTESLGLSLTIPGYTMSLKNKSLDRMNGNTLVGSLRADTVLQILFEPGEFQSPDFSRGIPPGVDWQPRNKPLEGVPPASL